MNAAALLDWAASVLPVQAHETVAETPWSLVMKLATARGVFYLKKTSPDLFIEAQVIKICRETCGISFVPEIVAENKSLHAFIMKDAGAATLRTLMNGKMDAPLLAEALQLYRQMQMATTVHVDEFIRAGVPDWRMMKWPGMYDALVANETLLLAEGMTAAEIARLQKLSPVFRDLCGEMADFGIPECLNHSDLQENNILYTPATREFRIIDLGESAIDHPLFCLASVPKRLWRYKLDERSAHYARIQDACLGGWGLPPEAFAVVDRLLPLYFVFTHLRLVEATADLASVPRMSNRVKDGLMRFLAGVQD